MNVLISLLWPLLYTLRFSARRAGLLSAFICRSCTVLSWRCRSGIAIGPAGTKASAETRLSSRRTIDRMAW